MQLDSKERKPKVSCFSRPFQVFILLSCLVGVGLWLFERHIAEMDDSPNGGTPLSWGFKMKTRNVEKFFSLEQSQAEAATQQDLALPKLDLQGPLRTETALFALG